MAKVAEAAKPPANRESLMRILRRALALFLLSSAVYAAEPLPGTKPLEMQGDLAAQMVDGIDKFLLDRTAASTAARIRFWSRNTSSPERYEASIAPNRTHLARIIGARNERIPFEGLELLATTARPSLVGTSESFEIHAVRWPVLPGVHGEGLWLKPLRGPVTAYIVALPDADQTPEMLCGLTPGIAPESQFARRLAENGCEVVIPALLDRSDKYSIGAGGERPTNQPHREFIYRQAFEMGQHVIGYEVQKVLALVDWFQRDAKEHDPRVGVVGYGEGGLLALYAGALDPRIDVTCVSGYFDARNNLWQEPIYRNVFGLLDEFGDAELATLIAPRTLIVEACKGPEISGPPPAKDGRGGAAPGRITTPTLKSVEQELARARQLLKTLSPPPKFELVVSGEGKGPPGSSPALKTLMKSLVPDATPLRAAALSSPSPQGKTDPDARLKRQFDELTRYTQSLMRESEYTRRKFWDKADRKSRTVEKWQETSEWYRTYFYKEVIGRFDLPLREPNVRTRQIYDEPKYTGYEVVLDVFPDVFAYGILLLPKDLPAGEKRPVVVCQHGLEGRPQDVATPGLDNPAYHNYAIKLAERGFITYAPQNPYIGQDRFRTLQRKANPLKKSLFSLIVPQHQQTVNWLAKLPMVDANKIAFYGLSYGGKTAMRVPALVPEYCLSICSADFNEWIWKNASARSTYSYLPNREYEIFEFDLGNTFNYAEMAGLIAPRGFMVERGHRDGVAPDEWVAYEYAKVRLLYADLKIPHRTTIEFFDGPHTINGVGTFDFLTQQLGWPK
jgi:dienelactone hydrolase